MSAVVLRNLVAAIPLVVLAWVTGCGKPAVPARMTASDTYPVRSDWLVASTPSGIAPSKWYTPGYPPLSMLNRPFSTLSGDDALLATQARNNVILNTSKADFELRDEFAKVLTELFGTPLAPKVPDGSQLVDQLKLNDKLAELRQTQAVKLEEAKKARSTAKTADEFQAADLLESQSVAATNDVRTLESRLEHLHSFRDDLQLDDRTLAHGGELYRSYCQQCHGATGDGNGPSASQLIPLPRDYRQGLFKFITTDPSVGGKRKPSRKDLYRTITRGMEGSPMPQFGALKDGEVQAIISYVIHLSMRGECEYEVMKKAANPAGDDLSREDVRKGLLEQAATVAPLWSISGKTPIVPDQNPYTTPDQVLESAANGVSLFNSSAVGCTTCHTGYGKAAPYQFDSWGSIVRPRNLTVPVLRGGRSPEEIYARIYGGILGSNMPAHTHLKPNLEEKIKGVNKIWDLVNFVLYVSESDKRELLKDKKQIDIDQ